MLRKEGKDLHDYRALRKYLNALSTVEKDGGISLLRNGVQERYMGNVKQIVYLFIFGPGLQLQSFSPSRKKRKKKRKNEKSKKEKRNIIIPDKHLVLICTTLTFLNVF